MTRSTVVEPLCASILCQDYFVVWTHSMPLVKYYAVIVNDGSGSELSGGLRSDYLLVTMIT